MCRGLRLQLLGDSWTISASCYGTAVSSGTAEWRDQSGGNVRHARQFRCLQHCLSCRFQALFVFLRQRNVTHLTHHCLVLPRRFHGWWREEIMSHSGVAHMSQDEPTRQLHMLTRRESTSSLTETPPLLAPNVFDCVEVSLQPRFIGERDVRQCRVVRSATVSQETEECMTKEPTALAPSKMKIKRVL